MMKLFSKLSKKEKIGVVISVIFVIIALIDRLIIVPVGAKISNLNKEIMFHEKILGKDLRNVIRKNKLRNEYEQYQQYIQQKASDEEEVAQMLSEIEKAARESGVYIFDIKPQPFSGKSFHKEYAVEIQTEAEMEPLVKFLYRLNNSSQLLRAEKIQLSLKKEGSPLSKDIILITKVLLL